MLFHKSHMDKMNLNGWAGKVCRCIDFFLESMVVETVLVYPTVPLPLSAKSKVMKSEAINAIFRLLIGKNPSIGGKCKRNTSIPRKNAINQKLGIFGGTTNCYSRCYVQVLLHNMNLFSQNCLHSQTLKDSNPLDC